MPTPMVAVGTKPYVPSANSHLCSSYHGFQHLENRFYAYTLVG